MHFSPFLSGKLQLMHLMPRSPWGLDHFPACYDFACSAVTSPGTTPTCWKPCGHGPGSVPASSTIKLGSGRELSVARASQTSFSLLTIVHLKRELTNPCPTVAGVKDLHYKVYDITVLAKILTQGTKKKGNTHSLFPHPECYISYRISVITEKQFCLTSTEIAYVRYGTLPKSATFQASALQDLTHILLIASQTSWKADALEQTCVTVHNPLLRVTRQYILPVQYRVFFFNDI